MRKLQSHPQTVTLPYKKHENAVVLKPIEIMSLIATVYLPLYSDYFPASSCKVISLINPCQLSCTKFITCQYSAINLSRIQQDIYKKYHTIIIHHIIVIKKVYMIFIKEVTKKIKKSKLDVGISMTKTQKQDRHIHRPHNFI